jgi:ABC-type sugar transport system substrate-binding protein
MTRKSTFITVAAAAMMAAAIAGPALGQDADTSDKRVAFSNNYAANSWRQAMLRSWDELAKEVVPSVVAAADVRTTPENDATLQQQQLSDMILEGYNAIVINAANPESLNSVIEEACAQGIPVVSFDGTVTADCAYRVGVDFVDMGYQEVKYLADRLPEGGNLLEIRGLAGTSIDEQISEGIHKGVEEFPQFTIVGSVHGDWAGDVTQQAVSGILPSMPEDIVGVVTQGGDGYGAAKAFEDAGDPGRGRLRCRQGLRGRGATAPHHHHGQPPGRAGLVEGAEGQGRLRDHVAVHRPRHLDGSLLGRPAAARRRAGRAPRHRRAVPPLGPGQLRGGARPDEAG